MSRLIPSAIVACLRGKPPVLHSGVADYIREFVYIDDAISAFRLISGKGLPGDAYCVGGTTHCTTYELIRRIIYNINPDIGKPEVHEKNAVFKEIEAQWMNADKLKLLGWEPKVSLEEGIRRTINYYKEIM
jgi:nucleoside-diphosphate-sugar epimerase